VVSGLDQWLFEMPLRCVVSETGESIVAFDLDKYGWQTLRANNKAKPHLRMPCCSADVVLKTSKYGLQFFAHKAEGACKSAPESENHLQLKRLVVEAARANGWNASPEVSGADSEGQQWVADVLATNGDHKVAVEIQWSPQTPEETMARHERYKRSGVRGLWLLRHPGFPVSKDLPAVCIGGSLASGFVAHVPEHQRMKAADRDHPERWRQSMPMQQFLHAVFQRRFQHGLVEGTPMSMAVILGKMTCWHPPCGSQTTILGGVAVRTRAETFKLSVSNFIGHERLLREIIPGLESRADVGTIKVRWSESRRRNYLSNGCCRCDRLIGEHFEYQADDQTEFFGNLSVPLTREWISIIETAYPDEAGWAVR